MLDLGDYLGLHGIMMRTKTGELTLRVKSVQLLAKATLPLPVPKVEERDGETVVHDEVKDVEFRYRQRYADLALNDDVAEVFRKRTLIVRTLRDYLVEQSYMEVETPVLQVLYGGGGGHALHDPSQGAGYSSIPARRHGALSEAAGGGWFRPGIRDRQGLPQRGH